MHFYMSKEYDHGSHNQRAANQVAADWLQEGAAAAAIVSPGIINILDLGSSTGKNSAQELKTAVETIHQRQAGKISDIVVTHIDTGANDWGKLFQTVALMPDSYLAASSGGRVYSHGSAKSFYEQVAPSSSIALIYSGMSIHWITRCKPLSDCWVQFQGTRDKDIYAANKQQAARDWGTFLQQRAKELIPGGYLIATGITMKSSERMDQLIEWGYESWREAFRQGLVSQAEFSSLAWPYWLRSREEWLAPLETDLQEAFDVLELQETTVTDPHWEEYMQGSGDQEDRAKALAEAHCRFIFGVARGIMSGQLVHKSPAEIECILNVMKATFMELAIAKPTKFEAPIALIVLRRK